jgi:hypothetical protein
MLMTAKFSGRCRDCGGTIRAGEKIDWAKGRGAAHVACDPSLRDGDHPAATHVVVDGPFSAGNDWRDNDEIPEWIVAICADVNGDDHDLKVYRCDSLEAARNLGCRIARERRLELVDEAMGA